MAGTWKTEKSPLSVTATKYLYLRPRFVFAESLQPITFTPKEYYRAWFTHLITTTPLEDLQKMETAYLGGETLTQNEVIKIWENKHREQLDVTYSNNLDERETRMKQNRVHNYWTQVNTADLFIPTVRLLK